MTSVRASPPLGIVMLELATRNILACRVPHAPCLQPLLPIPDVMDSSHGFASPANIVSNAHLPITYAFNARDSRHIDFGRAEIDNPFDKIHGDTPRCGLMPVISSPHLGCRFGLCPSTRRH